MVFQILAPVQSLRASRAELSSARRDVHIETLRGLACLLVVAYHVSNPYAGIQIAADNPLSILNSHLSPVRLPLFTFLSGYVYAMRPVMIGGEWPFLLGKFRRLLLPLFTVGVLFLLIQNAIPEAHHSAPMREVWRIMVFPYAHFWYLQALTLIFAAVVLMEGTRLMGTPGDWFMVFTVTVVAQLLVKFPVDFFSINGALYLMPFFTLGIGIRRFPELLQKRALGVIAGITALAGIAVYHLMLIKFISFPDFDSAVLRLMIGIAACIALFSVKLEWAPLASIGGFSYAIYLFHIFGTAGAGVILKRTGVDNTTILIVIALLAGIVLPILVEILADRFTFARLLLLGRNPRSWPNPRRAALGTVPRSHTTPADIQ